MSLKEPAPLAWDDRLSEADKNFVGDLNASVGRFSGLRAVEVKTGWQPLCHPQAGQRSVSSILLPGDIGQPITYPPASWGAIFHRPFPHLAGQRMVHLPMNDLQIRRLEPREWAAAFSVIVQLRPHLGAEDFLALARRQSHSGYELVGAFRAGRLVGVLGMRPVHTLVRGPHLHIDDIVVDETERKSGGGRALMAYAEGDARARGMTSVFLDARPEAIGFYQTVGYELHPVPSMKKLL